MEPPPARAAKRPRTAEADKVDALACQDKSGKADCVEVKDDSQAFANRIQTQIQEALDAKDAEIAQLQAQVRKGKDKESLNTAERHCLNKRLNDLQDELAHSRETVRRLRNVMHNGLKIADQPSRASKTSASELITQRQATSRTKTRDGGDSVALCIDDDDSDADSVHMSTKAVAQRARHVVNSGA